MDVGYSDKYKNDIELTFKNSNSILFEKIFHGAAISKKIYHTNRKNHNITNIKEKIILLRQCLM